MLTLHLLMLLPVQLPSFRQLKPADHKQVGWTSAAEGDCMLEAPLLMGKYHESMIVLQTNASQCC